MKSTSDVGQTVLLLIDVDTLPDSALAVYEGWLSKSEWQRYKRFVRILRARQFIVGRALLRVAIGRLVGASPETVVLAERPGRAPALIWPDSTVTGFSISHSGSWVACVASTVSAVGVDIELIDEERDVLALADQALGPAATRELLSCGLQERTAKFYHMWCAYEAGIKLGDPFTAVYSYMPTGLALVLCCATALPAAPLLEVMSFDSLR